MATLFLILGVCVFAIICPVNALPEDWKPRHVLGFGGFASTTFNGEEYRSLLDLQEVKLIGNDWAVITARNTIFVLDLKKIENENPEIGYSQVVPWDPNNSTTCALKASDRSKCNNFIRINVQLSENMFLICGTNARNPACREYEWNGSRFTDYYSGEACSQPASCLLDDEPSLAYLYSDRNLYMGTKVGFKQDPTLRRAPIDKKLPEADFGIPLTSPSVTVKKDYSLPHLSTDKNDASLLNDPEFISATQTEDKVFVFFKETATEQFGNGEVTFSRVAQVCKNDRGGSKVFLSHKWTSFFKARLNCSVPGRRPFAFNELQHVTEPLIFQGEKTVFAIMTTPENSIWGSAVCAYTIPDIEEAMSNDFAKHISTPGSSVCWSKYGQPAQLHSHPSSCPTQNEDTRSMDEGNLQFRKNHPLMKKAVQPVTDQPLFMATQAKYTFTAMDAETGMTVDQEGKNITMLYIGTSDGRLLKVVPRPVDVNKKYSSNQEPGSFVEEWDVYDRDKCDGGEMAAGQKGVRRVIGVNAVSDRNLILVAFRNCVVAVPKYLCSKHTGRGDCVQSGNPYCGWKDDSCVPAIDENRGHVEQDLFATPRNTPRSASEIPTTVADPFVPDGECVSVTTLAVSIAVSISASFIVAILLFLTFTRCKNTKKSSYLGADPSEIPNYVKGETLHDETNRRPIYNGPRKANINSSSSATFSASGLESFSGQQTDGEFPPGSASMDFINATFSRSNSSIIDGRNHQPVHVVENMRTDATVPPAERDPNLNNNNLKKNIGIAYALSRVGKPDKARSSDKDCDEGSEGSIRMGLTWGSSAGGAQQRQPPCWKSNSLRNRNIISVSPMPIAEKIAETAAQDQEYTVGKPAQSGPSARSDDMLPQPPANGCELPLKSPKVVSNYNSVKNAENRTFRRGKSLNEPYYSEPAEPEYENVKFDRKASTPGGFKSPLAPSTAAVRNFSSFTSSHFNTSWFPAPALQDVPLNFNPAACSGTESSISSASVSDAHQVVAESTYLQPIITSTLGRKNCGHSCKGDKARPSRRSADEGYGSEFIPSDDKRPSDGSSGSESHVYNNLSQGHVTSPLFSSISRSPDEDNIIKDLDALEWNRQDSRMKTLKKRKSSKKKKNTDQRAVVPDMSSPSDTENVFDESPALCPDFSSDTYRVYHDIGDIRQYSQTLDDSYIECSSKGLGNSRDCLPGNQYAFHTMRPPGRMRQKLPRLRHGPKDTEATLKAVPTPEIPRT